MSDKPQPVENFGEVSPVGDAGLVVAPPKKRGFFKHLLDSLLAAMVVVGAGAIMASFLVARFLVRWLLLFPFNIVQRALYLILYYFRNISSMAIALLVVGGGGLYAIDGAMDGRLGIAVKMDQAIEFLSEKISSDNDSAGDYQEVPPGTIPYTTLEGFVDREKLPDTLLPLLTISIPEKDVRDLVVMAEASQLGERGENAVPWIVQYLYIDDEETRTTADKILRDIGTREAIEAITKYYRYVEEAAENGQNTGN